MMETIGDLIKELESYYSKGMEILQEYREISEEEAPVRRYKGAELSRLAGVTLQSLGHAENSGRISPRDRHPTTNRILGSTLEQLNLIQNTFKTKPGRKLGDPPVTLSFTNFKGGCWKTTTSWYAGSYYANLGYKVLLVDLDPQATLTQFVGIRPDIDTQHENTLGPYVLDEDTTVGVQDIIQKTYNCNMDIIPSSLDLSGIEYAISNAIVMTRNTPGVDYKEILYWFYRVKDSLDEVKQNYDIVIMDGTPAMGLLPINIVFGADHVIVPVPTELADFASTLSFDRLFQQQLISLENAFDISNAQLPSVNFLPTRYAPSRANATVTSSMILKDIRDTFGHKALRSVLTKHDSVVSNLATWNRTVFDINPGDLEISREAHKKASNNFSAVFDEVLETAIMTLWPSHREYLNEKGAVL